QRKEMRIVLVGEGRGDGDLLRCGTPAGKQFTHPAQCLDGLVIRVACADDLYRGGGGVSSFDRDAGTRQPLRSLPDSCGPANWYLPGQGEDQRPPHGSKVEESSELDAAEELRGVVKPVECLRDECWFRRHHRRKA